MTRGLDEPWVAAPSLPAELGRAWMRDWTGWFGPGRVGLPCAPEKDWLALVETPIGPVVAKRERGRAWKRSLAALGALPPRTERAFRLAKELREAGLPAPEPLAVLGTPGKSALVVRYVEGAGPWHLAPEVATRERLLACLAEGIARLHAAGFRHRDMKASNVLLVRAGVELELVWVDLDGLAWRGTVEPHVRARDLARLCTSFASAEARAAGVRADAWPELVRRYLVFALGRPPEEDELEQLLARTRAWSERNIRRHLAADRPVR